MGLGGCNFCYCACGSKRANLVSAPTYNRLLGYDINMFCTNYIISTNSLTKNRVHRRIEFGYSNSSQISEYMAFMRWYLEWK